MRGGIYRPSIGPSVPAPVLFPYLFTRAGAAHHMAVHKSIPVVPHERQASFSPGPTRNLVPASTLDATEDRWLEGLGRPTCSLA